MRLQWIICAECSVQNTFKNLYDKELLWIDVSRKQGPQFLQRSVPS